HLFRSDNPEAGEGDYKANLNPESLEVIKTSMAEQGLSKAKPGERFQFLRHGYFCADPDSTEEHPVFNRTVSLRDSWARIQKAGEKG
ncbi:MAG: glutamine--tRNA ligase, partial [Spirochaetes bacterium]|nr:glutamine--tRNA ligase [Spirochaetota bacterium]